MLLQKMLHSYLLINKIFKNEHLKLVRAFCFVSFSLLTSGSNGGLHFPACNRLKLIVLKNGCDLTSLAPYGPHPKRDLGSLFRSWNTEQTALLITSSFKIKANFKRGFIITFYWCQALLVHVYSGIHAMIAIQ